MPGEENPNLKRCPREGLDHGDEEKIQCGADGCTEFHGQCDAREGNGARDKARTSTCLGETSVPACTVSTARVTHGQAVYSGLRK